MPPDFSTLDTWILAGQSNMQGIGLLDTALPPDDRVWAFTMAGNWEVATEPLHPLWKSYTPVHAELMWGALSPEERAQALADAKATGGGQYRDKAVHFTIQPDLAQHLAAVALHAAIDVV